MKRSILLGLIVASAFFSQTATAANDPNTKLCAKNWATLQNGAGEAFSSVGDCARSREIFNPLVEISPPTVGAFEIFTVTALGFHPSSGGTLSIAVTGQPPYFSFPVQLDEAGNVGVFILFYGCGANPPYDLTISVTDYYGVHASAPMTLCPRR